MNKHLDAVKLVKEEYLKVSSACMDLLLSMLRKDPKDRPTSKECLQHEWFESKISTHNHFLKMNKECVTPKRDDSLSRYLKSVKMKNVIESEHNLLNIGKRIHLKSGRDEENGLHKLSYQSVSYDGDDQEEYKFQNMIFSAMIIPKPKHSKRCS